MDRLTPAQRSLNMSRIRSLDTKPEIAVRRMVHAMGYRYRLYRRDLPGRPDLVFAGRRKIVFVHGCFWHQHRKSGCADARLPKSRLDYWLPKLERTAARDRAHLRALRRAGWRVLVIWECELAKPHRLAARLNQFLT